MSDPFDIPAETMETERLVLRALSLDDAPQVFTYSRDPEVSRHTLWAAHESEEGAREFLAMLLRPAALSWAICTQDGRTLIGMVFFHSLSRHHRRAELAFNLGRDSWGRGYATEAARAAVGFGFARLSLNRIEATCMPANAASRAVLLKIGMSSEGTMRQSRRRHDGFHDMELFGIVRPQAGPAPSQN
jgi:[ribosomal protein S5]-alanine N-acetyltransferase